MAEDGASLESPNSTGCCGCMRGQWFKRKPSATVQSGNAADGRQQWETVVPALIVPPASPVSVESSTGQSSVPTPTHRSTSPLDDEDLDLGFFTREHKASFVENGGGIISTLCIHAPTPPSTPPSVARPSGTENVFWASAGEFSVNVQDEDFARFQSQDSPAEFQEQEPAVSKAPGIPSQTPRRTTSDEVEDKDDKPSSVPRLPSPAHFLLEKIKREEIEGAQARSKEEQAATADPRVIVPLLATPDQFRLQKVREKELEESLKAKQDEDATVEAETRHRVPTLPSPEEVLSKKARQKASEEAQLDAIRATRLTEPKLIIPKLHPPGRSWEAENTGSTNLDPPPKLRVPSHHEGQGRDNSEAWNGEHDEAGQSPRYVELVSRIGQLSLDLETAKSTVQKSKLLLEWSQLRANSLEDSVAGLSEELTQQQCAYLDLQARHLAHIGINLPAASTSFNSEEATLSTDGVPD